MTAPLFDEEGGVEREEGGEREEEGSVVEVHSEINSSFNPPSILTQAAPLARLGGKENMPCPNGCGVEYAGFSMNRHLIKCRVKFQK
jgi:hypothetical protein